VGHLSGGATRVSRGSLWSRTPASLADLSVGVASAQDRMCDAAMFWESAVKRLFVVVSVIIAVVAFFGSRGVSHAAAACSDGPQEDGAVYRICMPASWNGQLIVFAHGYVNVAQPIGIPESQLVLPDGTSLIDIVTGLHFAFAMSSYSKNGLAIQQGIVDSIDLISIFQSLHGAPSRTFIVGVSEGGLVATLALERFPSLFAGGIEACGPVGGFQNQLNYFGDVRILFDYFFPGVIPGGPVHIPQSTIDDWDSTIEPAVRQALMSNDEARNELITVAHVAADAYHPSAAVDELTNLLWYNVNATNDAVELLGGVPFDNHARIYYGSANDTLLNSSVERVTEDPIARANVASYETSGDLHRPLIAMHTLGDEVVPYMHVYNYGVRLWSAGNLGTLSVRSVARFGHCNFTAGDALIAFVSLLAKT
jgi:pimeloyl-ACP methyl ester carboxylesterase